MKIGKSKLVLNVLQKRKVENSLQCYKHVIDRGQGTCTVNITESKLWLPCMYNLALKLKGKCDEEAGNLQPLAC